MKKIATAIVVAVTAFSAAAPAFAYYHHDRYYHHCHRVWHHHHWERVCRWTPEFSGGCLVMAAAKQKARWCGLMVVVL